MAARLTRLLLLVLALLMLGGCPGEGPADHQSITLGGEDFKLELALDLAKRFQGLSDRPSIPPAGGMLFVFPEPAEQCFVMRRCLVPIDLVFVGPTGYIVALHEMQMEPYDTPEERLRRYCSGWPVQFAIEVQAGTIRRLNLQPGQRVQLPLEELKQRAH